MIWARPGAQPLKIFATQVENWGNARLSDCPTVPVIAPSWKIVVLIMMNHHHRIQLLPKRGPPNSLMAPSVGLPEEMA